jgi:hypothetical protein
MPHFVFSIFPRIPFYINGRNVPEAEVNPGNLNDR